MHTTHKHISIYNDDCTCCDFLSSTLTFPAECSQLRLTKAQLEQKEASLAEVAAAQEKLSQNEDPNVQADLQAELESKESKLAELLKSFEVRALAATRCTSHDRTASFTGSHLLSAFYGAGACIEASQGRRD